MTKYTKYLLPILCVLIFNTAYAQSQESIRIDELTEQVNNLSHELEYLKCEYTLQNFTLIVSSFSNEVYTTSIEIDSMRNSLLLSSEMAEQLDENYKQNSRKFDIFSKFANYKIDQTESKLETYPFTEFERKSIKSDIDLLISALASLQLNMSRMKDAIKNYKHFL